MLNLAIILEESARRKPDKTAVILGDRSLSYARLNGAANQVAGGLRAAGIGKGDRVALSCPNIPYFPIVYFGILKTGATVVPLNVLLKQREIAYHLADADVKAYLCFQGTAELPMGKEGYGGFQQTAGCEHFFMITADPAAASPIAETRTLGMLMNGQAAEFDTVQTMPEDTAVILYTSGTTGNPKGAELTHFNIFFNAVSASRLFKGLDEDRVLVVLPMFHSFGQVVLMNTAIYDGGTQILLPRFDPEAVFKLLQDKGVTVFAGVPTMYWALLNHPGAAHFDLDKIADTLRLAVSGGAALPVEVLYSFETRFKVPIIEGYGLSETSPVAAFNHLDAVRKPGSIGTPIWGVEMRVIDVDGKDVPVGKPGEIVIRGHNVMKGYFRRPEINAEVLRDGWFHTGDVARKDADGYYFIVDRTKDMIIRGGFNVYPREIEDVMMTHPAVSLAAVIGVPHKQYGEEIKAFVVQAADAVASEQELISWCKENMADYKYPRMIVFRDALPMSATGKILKKELRKLA